MSNHTTARLISAGRGILMTEDGLAVFTALGPDLDANEARLIAIWDNHDKIVAENVVLREQLARKDDIFNTAINAALTLPDPVREQLVEALKLANEAMASGWSYVKDVGSVADEFQGASTAIYEALLAAGSAP